MERVDIDRPAVGQSDGIDRRGLSGPLNTAHVAINHYRIPPGEGLPSGLHTHVDQEEIFVVHSGTATFETLAGTGAGSKPGTETGRTGRRVTVDAGEAIRFAPGEYQSGYNRGDTELVVLAIGAPRESTDIRVPVVCPDCERADVALDAGGDALSFVCPDCGTERVPAPCPECGAEAMTITLDDENAVVAACEECDAEFETPPYRE